MSSHFGEQCLNSSHFRIVRSLFRRLAKYFSDDWRNIFPMIGEKIVGQRLKQAPFWRRKEDVLPSP